MDLSETAEPRIYVVVADIVQTELTAISTGFSPSVLIPSLDTLNIAQPAGRMAAQAAHAVSMVRVAMVEQELRAAFQRMGKYKDVKTFLLSKVHFQPITTIILEARDSFELAHVLGLLHRERISVEQFEDFNPEAYGTQKSVRTAIATWPVKPREVAGILDYLPLALREG